MLPTVDTSLGVIMQGTPGWIQQPPTLGPYEQVLAALNGKQDRLAGLQGQVVGFDESGNAVPADMPDSGDDGGGSSDSGTAYKFGHGLKQEGNTVSVDMANDKNPDKTLPISAAAVDAVVGNIEVILKTI